MAPLSSASVYDVAATWDGDNLCTVCLHRSREGLVGRGTSPKDELVARYSIARTPAKAEELAQR